MIDNAFGDYNMIKKVGIKAFKKAYNHKLDIFTAVKTFAVRTGAFDNSEDSIFLQTELIENLDRVIASCRAVIMDSNEMMPQKGKHGFSLMHALHKNHIRKIMIDVHSDTDSALQVLKKIKTILSTEHISERFHVADDSSKFSFRLKGAINSALLAMENSLQ